MSFFPAVIKWEKWLVLNTRLRSIFWVKNILFQQTPVMKTKDFHEEISPYLFNFVYHLSSSSCKVYFGLKIFFFLTTASNENKGFS